MQASLPLALGLVGDVRSNVDFFPYSTPKRLPPGGRQQQVACFCLDSILVRSARNTRHVTPCKPTPPNHHRPPSSGREGGEGRSGGGRYGGGEVGSARGEREEGREGPPSLGSQPLNQAFSHPVNLKQSRFNSSCLSAPAPENRRKARL